MLLLLLRAHVVGFAEEQDFKQQAFRELTDVICQHCHDTLFGNSHPQRLTLLLIFSQVLKNFFNLLLLFNFPHLIKHTM